MSREYPFSVITRLATSVTYADFSRPSFCAKALQSVVLPVDYTPRSVRVIILSAKTSRMAQAHRLKLNARLSLPFVWLLNKRGQHGNKKSVGKKFTQIDAQTLPL